MHPHGSIVQQPADLWRNSATEMFVNLRIHAIDDMLRMSIVVFLPE